MTIPTLVANYQNKSWNTAATVFERKLEEALKTMNTQQTLAGYKNTEDFVNELSKHFKITKICKNNELTSCFNDKVYWGSDNEEIEIADIKTAKNFGQDDWDTNVVGVQFANGTTGLIAYNPTTECHQDPYSNQITGTSCLAILYDTSGHKNPNTSGKDLRSINVTSLGSSNCYMEVKGICIANAPFIPASLTYDECIQRQNELGIKNCIADEDDNWGGAVKKCKDAGKRLPTMAELGKIAAYIYNVPSIGEQEFLEVTRDEDKVSLLLGFQLATPFAFWSEQSTSSRMFDPAGTYFLSSLTRRSQLFAVCVSD